MNIHWFDWPAPNNVTACYTLRTGGSSQPPYDSFNLGAHVGDDVDAVTENRHQLHTSLKQHNITWLNQVHGTRVLRLPAPEPSLLDADASFTQKANQVCCVMTADCLPVFLCDGFNHNDSNAKATQVATAHAGWRGLLDGILLKTVNTFDDPKHILAYLGPAISQQAFEVGDEVRAQFIRQSPQLLSYFIPSQNAGKWMADLYGIASVCLREAGVEMICGGDRCTYTEHDQFFSYRRDGETGRMANMIWLDS